MKQFLIYSMLCLAPLSHLWAGEKFAIALNKDRIEVSIQKNLLGKDMIFTSRVLQLSEQKNISAGQTYLNPYLFRLEKIGDNIVMRKIVAMSDVADSSVISSAVMLNNAPAVIDVFPITGQSDESIRFNIKPLFKTLNVHTDPLPKDAMTGSVFQEISGVQSVYSFDNGVSIESDYYTSGRREPFFAKLRFTLYLAPEPMDRRADSPKIGYFTSQRTMYNDSRVDKARYIHRWRVEPSRNDRNDYINGKVVEPEHKIIFMFDTSTPNFIKQYASQGITDWNRAFEKIGFRNVIEISDADPSTVIDNGRVNVFRYIPTERENAQGVIRTDPRTGEVLQADILWFHNVTNLLKTWRYVQTAAADSRVRDFRTMPDSLVGEMIRYAVAHEMGHVLGLSHNMIASASRSVDELKTLSSERGTSSSIMDYARCNYVAGVGSAENGVAMLPPILGEYDYYALEYGYRYFTDKTQETELLRQIVDQKSSQTDFRYNKGQSVGAQSNPLIVENTLSSNLIKSGTAGIANLKYMLPRIVEWNGGEEADSDIVSHLYDKMINQYFLYVNTALSYVGGCYDDTGIQRPSLRIETQTQLKALDFVTNNLIIAINTLTDNRVSELIGDQRMSIIAKQQKIIESMFSTNYLRQVESGIGCASMFRIMTEKLFDKSYDELYGIDNLRATYLSELKKLSSSNTPDSSSIAAANEWSSITKHLSKKYRNYIKTR